MELFYQIQILFTFASLIPFVIGILKFKTLNQGLKKFFILTCFFAFSDLLNFTVRNLGYTTLWGLNFYVPIEFLLLSLVYIHFLEGFIHKKYIYILIALFITFSIIYSVFILHDFLKFNSPVMGLRSLIFIIYSVVCFYKMLIELKIKKHWQEPISWINTAVLFVHSSLLFIFILSNYILSFPQETAKFILSFPLIIIGIGYMIMGFGLLKVTKQPIA